MSTKVLIHEMTNDKNEFHDFKFIHKLKWCFTTILTTCLITHVLFRINNFWQFYLSFIFNEMDFFLLFICCSLHLLLCVRCFVVHYFFFLNNTFALNHKFLNLIVVLHVNGMFFKWWFRWPFSYVGQFN